jgi:hypothetical protein
LDNYAALTRCAQYHKPDHAPGFSFEPADAKAPKQPQGSPDLFARGAKHMTGSLPQEAGARKAAPMAEGLLWYFPNALAEVARVSKAGNDQHNAGQPLHHARNKSTDHADCIIRHLVDAGTIDSDGMRHSAKVAWRALALLQEELEREEGAPLPRNARVDHSQPLNCDGYLHAPSLEAFAKYGATHSKADALHRFARDNECTGL